MTTTTNGNDRHRPSPADLAMMQEAFRRWQPMLNEMHAAWLRAKKGKKGGEPFDFRKWVAGQRDRDSAGGPSGSSNSGDAQ